jgi:predicted kinase
MCGIIGSGKSTWAKEFIQNNKKVIIINRDSIREMFNGGIYDYKEEVQGAVRNSVRSILLQCLDYNLDIIIDETNITKEHRKTWINLIRDNSKNTNIICVYCSEKEKNLERRKKDTKGLSFETWEKVYNQMLENFEEPTIDEGFDYMIFDKLNFNNLKCYCCGEKMCRLHSNPPTALFFGCHKCKITTFIDLIEFKSGIKSYVCGV